MGMSRTSPRAAPEESRRSSVQFALWVPVSAAKQEYPTIVVELDLGHFQVKALLELVAAWSQGRPPKSLLQEVAARPASLPPGAPGRRPRLTQK